jgi:hypothetical protein
VLQAGLPRLGSLLAEYSSWCFLEQQQPSDVHAEVG